MVSIWCKSGITYVLRAVIQYLGPPNEKQVAVEVGIAVGSRHRWPAGLDCSSYRIRP